MRHTYFFSKTVMCKPLQFKGEAHWDEEVSQISVVKLMRHLPLFTRQTTFNLLKNIQVLFPLMFPSLQETPYSVLSGRGHCMLLQEAPTEVKRKLQRLVRGWGRVAQKDL